MKDPAKEERNNNFRKFIYEKIDTAESNLICLSDFQKFDAQTKRMIGQTVLTDKLLNHINQLMANDSGKEKLSKDIVTF